MTAIIPAGFRCVVGSARVECEQCGFLVDFKALDHFGPMAASHSCHGEVLSEWKARAENAERELKHLPTWTDQQLREECARRGWRSQFTDATDEQLRAESERRGLVLCFADKVKEMEADRRERNEWRRRAEAAEAAVRDREEESRGLQEGAVEWKRRAEAAEAKLGMELRRIADERAELAADNRYAIKAIRIETCDRTPGPGGCVRNNGHDGDCLTAGEFLSSIDLKTRLQPNGLDAIIPRAGTLFNGLPKTGDYHMPIPQTSEEMLKAGLTFIGEGGPRMRRVGVADVTFPKEKCRSCSVSLCPDEKHYCDRCAGKERGPGIAALPEKRPDNSVAFLDEDLLAADAE